MTDSQTVRWGIVGPGRIASLVIKDFPYVAGAEAVAVASRSIERAQAFATDHGLSRAYGSYAESITPLPSPP
jgi:predicted dehydrogenase